MTVAAIYSRVSSQEQADSGTSLDSQAQRCSEYASANGWDIAKGYVVREDWTGTDLERPGLEKLQEGAGRFFDVLLCFTLDRLYRPKVSGDEWKVFALIDRFQQSGVRVEFVDPTMLADGPLAGVNRFLRSWMAGEERRAIIERTTRGKLRRAAEGRVTTGFGLGIFGYDYDKGTKRLAPNDIEAETVLRIFTLAAARRPVRAIVRELNESGIRTKTGAKWGGTTIYRILQNPTYRGDSVYGRRRRIGTTQEAQPESSWISVPGAVPEIVSHDLWAAAQLGLAVHKPSRNPRAQYLLTTFATCGLCGRAVSGFMVGRRWRYYRCGGRASPSDSNPCRLKYVRADFADAEVWNRVSNVLSNPEIVLREMRAQQTRTAPALEAEVENLKHRLNEVRVREHQLVKLYEFGQIDDQAVQHRAREVKNERARLQSHLIDVERQIIGLRRLDEAIPSMRDIVRAVKGKLESADFEHKRNAFEALQVQVIFQSDGSFTISGALDFANTTSS